MWPAIGAFAPPETLVAVVFGGSDCACAPLEATIEPNNPKTAAARALAGNRKFMDSFDIGFISQQSFLQEVMVVSRRSQARTLEGAGSLAGKIILRLVVSVVGLRIKRNLVPCADIFSFFAEDSKQEENLPRIPSHQLSSIY
jgi:hypothetical protein